MKNFSNALLALYEAAENVPAVAFVRAAVHVLRPLFRHDAAILCTADISATGRVDHFVDHIIVCGHDDSMPEEYVRVPDHSHAVRSLTLSLPEPLCCDFPALLQHERLPAMEKLVRKQALQHVMLFGSADTNERLQWAALFRRAPGGFTREESLDLLTLWPHIERCLRINRARHLESQIRRHESRAAALINRRGFVEAADPRFSELHALEWPSSLPGRLAGPVLESLCAGRDYEGAHIRIALCAQDDLFLCKAFEKNLLSALTPAELAVAREFSRGLTHKAVALNLGVSENTVRSHIKHVYDKLAIHNKARLVQLMAASHLP